MEFWHLGFWDFRNLELENFGDVDLLGLRLYRKLQHLKVFRGQPKFL